MKRETLAEAIELAEKLRYFFINTADAAGLPHAAVAAEMLCGPAGCVLVRGWFCPGTVKNLRDNPQVSLVVWDPKSDRGHQLVGTVQDVVDCAVLDGYSPRMETAEPMPQVERELVVRVESILRFTHAPHTDVEE